MLICTFMTLGRFIISLAIYGLLDTDIASGARTGLLQQGEAKKHVLGIEHLLGQLGHLDRYSS